MAQVNYTNEQAIEALYENVRKMICEAMGSAPYDITKTGVIVGVKTSGKFPIKIDNVEYELPSLIDNLDVNSVVKVIVPQNNLSAAFILGRIIQ